MQRGGAREGREVEGGSGDAFSKFSRIMSRVITIDDSKGRGITADSGRLHTQ